MRLYRASISAVCGDKYSLISQYTQIKMTFLQTSVEDDPQLTKETDLVQ